MCEELGYQVEENRSVVQRQLICEVITREKEVKIIAELPMFLRKESKLMSITRNLR